MANATKFNIKGTEANLKDATNGPYSSIGCLPIVDLGNEYTPELKNDISSGTFAKAVVGGRLTLNSHKYLFAHPDYWYGTGDIECTSHHMLVVPEDCLSGHMMEQSPATTNGYALSFMRKTILPYITTTIKNDFGADNILSHREYFTNKSANGYATAGAWYDSEVDLMNEIMVYGTQVFTNVQNGTNIPTSYTIDKSQLLLFAFRPDLIYVSGEHWWLRDVASSTDFACVNSNGYAMSFFATANCGIRPAFAIC